MNVFDEINSWSAETILSRINLPLARDGKSYICPLCENGKGENGDGIRPRISKGHVRWKCHKCGKDFSNFDLAAASFGLDADRETAESARRIKEEFGLKDSNETSSFSREKKSARSAGRSFVTSVEKISEVSAMIEKKSASIAEPKNYAKFYEHCRANVDKFLAAHGGSFRGLTAETFKKYGIGYHPEFGVEGAEKCPHVIIPYDDCHFFARACEGHARSQHGQGAGLYEPVPISLNFANIIVEGEINALSIAQVWETYDEAVSGVIATGGATKYDKVVTELEKRFANAEQKPLFIVMFDNDEAGMKNGTMLVTALKAAGYPAEFLPFEERLAGSVHEYSNGDGTIERVTVKKVDANDLLQNNSDRLYYFLFHNVFYSIDRLHLQAEQMRKQAQQAEFDKSGIRISSFTEYFAADFFSDIKLTEKYSIRKTGFEDIDAAQVLMPGLYVLGALPATGKTTFAWQLLNQLAKKEMCIYCSYEMSRAELYAKSMARELYRRYPDTHKLNLSSVNIRRGAGKDCKELLELANSFTKSTTNLLVLEPTNLDITGLIAKLKPLVAQAQVPVTICLDYLQIIPNKNPKISSTKEKIDDIALRLKNFQRETNSTLIVISSFNRENYYKPISFSSFKESGAIEYSADCLWGLENYGVDDNGMIVEDKAKKEGRKKIRDIHFVCLKNRNGGQYDTHFRYFAEYDYFEPLKEEKRERPKHEH